MSTTNFEDGRTPIIASWLNDVDAHVYDQEAVAHQATNINYTPSGTGAVARSVANKMSEFVSVMDFIPAGIDTATTDCTGYIQAAIDSGAKTVFFPSGTYKVTATEGASACLTLSKNVNLVGLSGSRHCIIEGALTGVTTASVLKVAITDAGGYGDVRNWFIDGLGIYSTTGGKHAIHIDGATAGTKQILTSRITNCSVIGYSPNSGYGIYIEDNLAHCEIAYNTIENGVYAKCYDANVFRKNTTFGKTGAFTFDCIVGVRNNTVRDNTIVNRDGAVRIINGDNIRIINNQMEQAVGYSPAANQNSVSSMIWLEGVARTISNTVILENNFGGGTNVDKCIYIDSATRTVIDYNNFVAVNVAEIYLTANSSYNIVGKGNTTLSQASNPRTNQLFKAVVTDLGAGNMGISKSASTLNLQNNWSGSPYFKDQNGVLNFIGTFDGGTTTSGTTIGTLPLQFAPFYMDVTDAVRRNLFAVTEEFDDSYWTKSRGSITPNVILSPDTYTTGDLFTQQSGQTLGGTINISYASFTTSTYTLGVFAKKKEKTFLRVNAIGVNTYFNLTTGAVGTVGAGHTAGIKSVGDGWYLCYVSFTGNSGIQLVAFGPVDADNSTTVTDSGGAYFWGAQLVNAASLGEYQRIYASTYTTKYLKRKFQAMTDSGAGSLYITRNGEIIVDSLPSNSQVSIPAFETARVEPL